VLVTPAFPETGRTVYLGNLFVGQVPLNESPMKDHPLNPMRDANLVRVLARQSQGNVGLASIFAVAGGAEKLRERLAELAKSGHVAAIADAVFERDLEVIGEVAVEAKLSTGASGLGLGLARALINKPAIVLADEPTGNLDSKNSDVVLGMLRQSNQELGQTVLMITHNPEAAKYGDRIIHMRDGQIVKPEDDPQWTGH